MNTLVDRVDMIEKPEGVHNINTKLFSISFPQLRSLRKLILELTNYDCSSAEYRVTAVILDITNYKLFKPVRSDVRMEKPKHFMKITFLNKGVDAINLQLYLNQYQSLTKFQCILEIKNHQLQYKFCLYRAIHCTVVELYHLNILAVLPANCLMADISISLKNAKGQSRKW